MYFIIDGGKTWCYSLFHQKAMSNGACAFSTGPFFISFLIIKTGSERYEQKKIY